MPTETIDGGAGGGEPPEHQEPTGRIHEQLWGSQPPVVGMVHLLPLPGSPEYRGSMAEVRDRARQDADRLLDGGVDGLLVENYGDRPFFPEAVPKSTGAAMAVVLSEMVADAGVPVGVNVLRNDASAALAIATVSGARFIRVNVHTGSMFTDQGFLEGRAHRTLREREESCPDTAILADVFVKHATPPPGLTLLGAARDTWIRGLADGLILTGAETGQPADPAGFGQLRSALPDGAKLWVGSGVTQGNVEETGQSVDGMIIGSAFQKGGLAGAGVEVQRVRGLMRALGRG